MNLDARTGNRAASSPEVDLLLRCPDDKGDVAVASSLLPHFEGRSLQHVTVHHGHRAGEAPPGGEIHPVLWGPGRVVLPRDGVLGGGGRIFRVNRADDVTSSRNTKQLRQSKRFHVVGNKSKRFLLFSLRRLNEPIVYFLL